MYRPLFFATALSGLANMTSVIRLEPHYTVIEVAQYFIKQSPSSLYLITRSLKRARCYSSVRPPPPAVPCTQVCRAQGMLFQWNGMQRSLYWNSRGIPFLSERSPCRWFSFSHLAFIHFSSDFLTRTFITFVIIYSKISCLKMKSPQKTLGLCLQEGKFLFWKIHKTQPFPDHSNLSFMKWLSAQRGEEAVWDQVIHIFVAAKTHDT